MRKVYKYTLPFPSQSQGVPHHVSMVRDAIITRMDFQHGKLCLWAVVNIAEPERLRVFRYVLTGAAIHPSTKQVWTVTPDDYATVYHVMDCGQL